MPDNARFCAKCGLPASSSEVVVAFAHSDALEDLNKAAKNGDVEAMINLGDMFRDGNGANINAADKEDGDDDDSTMLRVAAYNGDAEEVKFLLELRADVNVALECNVSPCMQL